MNVICGIRKTQIKDLFVATWCFCLIFSKYRVIVCKGFVKMFPSQ